MEESLLAEDGAEAAEPGTEQGRLESYALKNDVEYLLVGNTSALHTRWESIKEWRPYAEDDVNYCGVGRGARGPLEFTSKVIRQRSILRSPFFWIACFVAVAASLVNEAHPETSKKVLAAFGSPLPHSLAGAALSLALGFKLNFAAARWWDGRNCWALILQEARDIAAQLPFYVVRREAQDRIARLILAFAHVAKMALRDGGELRRDELVGLVDAREAEILETSKHKGMALCQEIRAIMFEEMHAHPPSPLVRQRPMVLMRRVDALLTALVAAEKINTTPTPVAYDVHLRLCLLTWLVSLPLVVAPSLGWGSVAAVALVAFVVLGLEEASDQIEAPFGDDFTDLPLAHYCCALRGQMAQMMFSHWARADAAQPAQPAPAQGAAGWESVARP